MNKKTFSTPVLLIAFNRPDVTKISFDKIREIKPQKLYVTIDGPRIEKKNDFLLCNQVEKIAKEIDWDCDAKYLIREKNVGCRCNVVDGLKWVFENEDRAIIIEDDIVAEKAFFDFADQLLEIYKDDERIAMISANNYTPIHINEDYLFSIYGHIWGWATWKRVWGNFDVKVPELKKSINDNFSKIQFLNNNEKKHSKEYFTNWYSRILRGTENAWGPQFAFYRRYYDLLSIVPKVNLASNIGNISSRTDSNSNRNENYYSSCKTFKIERHPNSVMQNLEYDRYHFDKHIKRKSIIIRIFKRCFKAFNSSSIRSDIIK